MCHISVIVFGAKSLATKEVQGKRVIEIGYSATGTPRPIIESMEPKGYIGVNLKRGPGVDVICNAEKILKKFGKESFDLVIATELLEHVRNWRLVISNIKNICKPDGIILITTRSFGYPYHPCPGDFWRYELKDLKVIFSDCEILCLEKDNLEPGVFIKIKKTNNFQEKNLSDYKLYSIVTNKRVKDITNKDFRTFYFQHLVLKDKIKYFLTKINSYIFSKI